MTITGVKRSERLNMTAMYFLWKFLSECYEDKRQPSRSEVEEFLQKEKPSASLSNAFESLVQKLQKITDAKRRTISGWFVNTPETFFLTKEGSNFHKN